jgi:hypothetical protein
MQPQITTDSLLGRFLTEQARRAQTTVEVGTGGGQGSTVCIHEGMSDNALFYTIEADLRNFKEVRTNTPLSVIPLYGVLHRHVRPVSDHPCASFMKAVHEMHAHETKITADAPLITFPSSFKIDLLFLDGGEFTTNGDFMELADQSRTIVIDDCNPEKACKTSNLYVTMKDRPQWWTCLADHIDDRNGWACFERVRP